MFKQKKTSSYYKNYLEHYTNLQNIFSNPTDQLNQPNDTANVRNLSQIAVGQRVAMLNVYYESMYYTAVIETASMTFSDLLGIIGIDDFLFLFF